MVVDRSRCRPGPIGILLDHEYYRAAMIDRFDMAPPDDPDMKARACDVI
jgi:hypothetical protein